MHALAPEVKRHLATALRLIAFRPIERGDITATAPAVVAMVALSAAGRALLELTGTDDPTAFDARGLSAEIAFWAVAGALLSLLRTKERPFDVPGVLAVAAATSAILAWLLALGQLTGPVLLRPFALAETAASSIALAALLVVLALLVAAAWRLGSAATQGRAHRLRVWLPAVLAVSMFVVPHNAIFASDEDARFDIWRAIDLWRSSRRQPDQAAAAAAGAPRPPRIDVEAAFYRQPELVEAATETLLPSPPGAPQIYFVGFAGYASQDVFKREVGSVRDLFDTRFGTAGRSVVLLNHRDSLHTLPLANATNLDTVLGAVARRMDVEKDFLVLFLTSHGSQGQFAVHFPRFSMNDLTPARLAASLHRSGIRNRIVVISACHSGSFIAALEDPGTLVMAAAHAERTSFGCSHEREWTYFGDALFNRALRSTYSFTQAFQTAHDTVGEWERAEKLTPSLPQISLGAAIAGKLPQLESALLVRSLGDAGAREASVK